MCIFVRKALNFNKIDIPHTCTEKDLEICAVDMEIEASKLIVLCIYRAPIGDFNQFLKKLDDTLKYLYKPKAEFLLCGNLNTDYLHDSNRKKYLSSLLTTYNLSHTVDFATRIQNKSSTATDYIFVDNSRLGSTIISSLINGLSDHDAQLLTINNIHAATKKVFLQQGTRTINRETFSNFQPLLKQETWQSVYQTQDNNLLTYSMEQVLLEKLASLQLVKKFPAFYGTRRFLTALTSPRQDNNNTFNSFLNTFLHVFETSFPVK